MRDFTTERSASTHLKTSLIESLKRTRPIGIAVVLPDFSLNVRLSSNQTVHEIMKKMRQVHDSKGGVVGGDFVGELMLGGSSAITGRSLSMLGAETYFVGRTSPVGKKLLRDFYRVSKTKICVDDSFRLNLTFILETGGPGDKNSNLIFSDPGTRLTQLTPKMVGLMKNAKVVSVHDYWYVMRPDTARQVFKIAKDHGAFTFLDTCDPSGFERNFPELFKILREGLVDRLGMNQKEATCYGTFLKRRRIGDPIEAARIISEKLNIDVDLHTRDYAFSCAGADEYLVPCYQIEDVRRLTGAGDHWNGGSLYAELIDLKPAERLLFSNSVAAFYTIQEESTSPSLKDAIHLIETRKLKLTPPGFQFDE